ncbi:MAG: PAS domain-containing protein [Pseudomonadales bacterium]|nr:PAS domain-containing protein [Pseudomonadales bacterium]
MAISRGRRLMPVMNFLVVSLLILVALALFCAIWFRKYYLDYRYLYDDLPVPMFRVDSEFRLVRCNRLFASKLGYTSVEECLLAYDDGEHLYPSHRKYLVDEMTAALRYPVQIGREVSFQRRGGDSFRAGVELFALLDAELYDLRLTEPVTLAYQKVGLTHLLGQHLIPTLVINADYQIILANKVLGFDPSGQSLEELVDPGAWPHLQQAARQCFANGQPARLMFPLLLPDQKYLACDWVLLKPDNWEKHLLLIAKERQPERLSPRELLDRSPLQHWGFWRIDILNDQLHYSRDWAEKLGYPELAAGGIVGYWQELVTPEDQERVLKAFNDFKTNAAPTFDVMHRLVTSDGVELETNSMALSVVRDDAGNAISVEGIDLLVDGELLRRESPLLLSLQHQLNSFEKRIAALAPETLSSSQIEQLSEQSREMVNSVQQLLAGETLPEAQRILQVSQEAGIQLRLFNKDRMPALVPDWGDGLYAQLAGACRFLQQVAGWRGTAELSFGHYAGTSGLCVTCQQEVPVNDRLMSLRLPGYVIPGALGPYFLTPGFNPVGQPGESLPNDLFGLANYLHDAGGHLLFHQDPQGITLGIVIPDSRTDRSNGRVLVITPDAGFGEQAANALTAAGMTVSWRQEPLTALDWLRSNAHRIDLLVLGRFLAPDHASAIILALQQIRADLPVLDTCRYSDQITTGYAASDSLVALEGEVTMERLEQSVKRLLQPAGTETEMTGNTGA